MDNEVVQGFSQLYMMVIAIASFAGALTTIIAFLWKLRTMRKEKEKEKKHEEEERDTKYANTFYDKPTIDAMAKRLEDLINNEVKDSKEETDVRFHTIEEKTDKSFEKSEARMKAFCDRAYVKKEIGTGFFKDIEHLKNQMTDVFDLYNKLRDRVHNGG